MSAIFDGFRGKWHGLKNLCVCDNWFQLIVERTFFPGTTSVMHRLDGLEFVVDYSAGEQNGTRACITQLQYECFIREMDLPGSLTILDLGANGGGFPLMMKRLGKALEHVVAVELNPRTYGRLCFNLQRNLDCRLEVVNAGVAAESGDIELALGGGSIGDSIFQREITPGTRMQKLPLIALDRLIDERFPTGEIDLCKMDIEGAEFPILASPVSDKLVRARNLILEIHGHPDYSEEWVHRRLASLGFELLPARSPFEENVFGYRRA